MADKKILDNEMLSDNELDNVAGGTFDERADLQHAIGKIYLSAWRDEEFTYLPSDKVAPYLKEHFGIDATINQGKYLYALHAFVTKDKPNEYSRNGQTLTHQQVLDIINGK